VFVDNAHLSAAAREPRELDGGTLAQHLAPSGQRALLRERGGWVAPPTK
jgi:hypothetical protein